MQLTPLVPALQQSLATLQRSPTWLQPLLVDPQIAAPASLVVSQNPLQQSVPVEQVAPSAWHGSSAQ